MAHSFFVKSRYFLQSSLDLYKMRQKELSPDITFGLLLVHGIELALKSFILVKNPGIDIKTIKDRFGHNYKKTYKYCLTLDKDGIIKDDKLKQLINTLSDKFFFDTIDARFPKGSSKHFFPHNTFVILKEKLMDPMPLIFGPDRRKKTAEISFKEKEGLSFL